MLTDPSKARLRTVEFSAPIEYIYGDGEIPTSTLFQTQEKHELRGGAKECNFSDAAKNSLNSFAAID
jgi:hypothetical protein